MFPSAVSRNRSSAESKHHNKITWNMKTFINDNWNTPKYKIIGMFKSGILNCRDHCRDLSINEKWPIN